MSTFREPPTSPAPPLKRISHLSKRLKRNHFDSIVHITVGPEKEVFKLHKGLLCNASPFFKAALEGRFVESINQAIDMPEEDVVMFRYLQMWLYTDSFLEAGEKLLVVPWRTLIDIYAFAETHLIPDLQNATMNAIFDKHELLHRLPNDKDISYMYAKTLATSPIRRWIVDVMATWCDLLSDRWWDGLSYPNEFLVELLRELYGQKVGFCRLLSRPIRIIDPDEKPHRAEGYHIPLPAEGASQKASKALNKPPSPIPKMDHCNNDVSKL